MASDTLGGHLKYMADVLKAVHRWSMADTLAYLGLEVGAGTAVLRSWFQNRGGVRPPNSFQLERLVQIGVAEAGMDRRWAEHVLYQGRHPERAAVLRSLFSLSQVRHNLPQRPYVLVGRGPEIEEIMDRLSLEARHWIVPIEGIGGIGKTALAVEIAWQYVEKYDRLPGGLRFDAIIWASAKREVLSAQGILPTGPTLTTVHDIYRAIAEVLECPGALRSPDDEEKRREIISALRKAGRVLLVIDNLEAIDDPQFLAVLAFLSKLPALTKAVVTTREHEDLPYPIHLGALRPEAARALVIQECEARDFRLDESQIASLLEATGRLPLALWWAIGLMSLEGHSLAGLVGRLKDRQGDLCRFVFEVAVARLRADWPDAYRALLALSFFDIDSGAAYEALSAILCMDLEPCRSVMQRLLNLNLAYRTAQADRFTLLPLTQSYARAEAADDPAWEREARGRWCTYYLQLASQGEERGNFERLHPESGNFSAVMAWLVSQGQWDDLAAIYRGIRGVFYAYGPRETWDLLLEYADRLLDWSVAQGRADVAALTVGSPTYIYRKRDETVRAEAWLRRVRLAAVQLQDPELTAEVLLARGYSLDRYSVFAHADALAKEEVIRSLQGLRELSAGSDSPAAIEALNALGNCHRWMRDFERAVAYFQEAQRVLHALTREETLDKYRWGIDGPDFWQTTLKGNLALVAGAQGKFDEARTDLLAIRPHLIDETDVAEVYAALALYEHLQGHEHQALVFRAEVDRRKATLGIKQPICIEDAQWEDLHRR